MSDRTRPLASGLDSLAPAFILDRLHVTTSGRSAELARLLWFAILSHAPWDCLDRTTWANDITLAFDVGIAEHHELRTVKRDVERGIARLREAGMLATPVGARTDGTVGRILVPTLAHPVKVLFPDRAAMTNLWVTCGEVRDRPATLVTMVVGMFVLASHKARQSCDAWWAPIPGTRADIRRLVGARKNVAFTQRMRDLETLDLVRTIDGVRHLAPVRLWYQSARALARVEPTLYPEIGVVPF